MTTRACGATCSPATSPRCWTATASSARRSTTTVRVKDGERLLTDGPFAETKEQLAGFYLLDCADLDEAVAYAAKIPGAQSGCVEVRPVRVFASYRPARRSTACSGTSRGGRSRR